MPLSQLLLDRLENQLQRLQPPWLETLRPGLTPEDAMLQLEPLGLTLPPELQTWWGWHNGASESVHITPVIEMFGLGCAVSLARTHHELALDVAQSSGQGDVQDLWPSTYLPVFGWAQWTIATDCSVNELSSPLFVIDPSGGYDKRALLAPSIGDLVHRWVEMYEAGYYVRTDDEVGWASAGLATNIAPLNLI